MDNVAYIVKDRTQNSVVLTAMENMSLPRFEKAISSICTSDGCAGDSVIFDPDPRKQTRVLTVLKNAMSRNNKK